MTTEPISNRARWAGRILSGVVALALFMDAAMKLVQAQPAVQGTLEVGFPASTVFGLGLVLSLSLALYLVPRVAPLGAVLLTGYLGGAIATHVRLGNPLFSHVLAPVYVAAFVWGGLWLRDARVRGLLSK